MLEYQSAFSEFPNPNLNSGIVQVSMVNLIRKREEKHNPIYIAQIDMHGPELLHSLKSYPY